MVLRIELWTEAGLTDGMERWWDDVDAWLDAEGGRRERHPVTASIDAYGMATVDRGDMSLLLQELDDLVDAALPDVAAAASELAALCSARLGCNWWRAQGCG